LVWTWRHRGRPFVLDSFNPSVGILLVWTQAGLCNGASPPRFNPSVGILLVWTGGTRCHRLPSPSFNPSVGILLVWTSRSPRRPHRSWCFNPSVGILLVWTSDLDELRELTIKFQSLGRDSVGLDLGRRGQSIGLRLCFNPSVGILLVWTGLKTHGPTETILVSIPRSGFCWFGLDMSGDYRWSTIVSIPRCPTTIRITH